MNLNRSKHHFLLAVAAPILAAIGPNAGAAALAAEFPDAPREAVGIAGLERDSLVPVRVQIEPASGRVTRLLGRFDAGTGERETVAREFLARHAALLGLGNPIENLRLARRVRDIGGEVLSFAQDYRGIPVFEGSIVVGFDTDARIVSVTNEYVPGLELPSIPRITADQAIARADAAVGGSFAGRPDAARLVVARGDKEHPGFHLTWEIRSYLEKPLGDWHVFVDARSGTVVRTLNQLKQSGPACVPCSPLLDPNCGLVFEENPVDGLDDLSLDDSSPVDKAERGCALGHLTSPSSLDGQWVNTSITSPPRASPPYNFYRSVDQPRLDEVNVYYHIDRAKSYLETLGFPNVMAFSIRADAHDPGLGDDSHYVPSTKIVEFGTGGVDDAQDADVIYHEYGHAIQDNQVPGFGTTGETDALGEGFADYWAASISDQSYTSLLGQACLATWDATAYNPYAGVPGTGCLRRTDEPLLFPNDLIFIPNEDGVIWSSALWRLRNDVGGVVVDPILIKSHTYLTQAAKFVDAADALILADQALFGGSHADAIHAAMAAQGIPRTATPASSSGFTNSATYVCQSSHPYDTYEYRECRFTRPGALKMRFYFTSFNTENGFDNVYISDDAYNQVQVLSGTPFGAGGGFSAAVSGDTIVARFKADGSINAPGFAIGQVQFVGPPPSPAGRVPDGHTAPGIPLTIDRTQLGDLALSWGDSCAGSDIDFEIYEGTLGNFASHVPRTCSTGGLTTFLFAPGVDNGYYLVVPRNFGNEGSYGTNSSGGERPVALAACLPQDVLPVCP